MFTLENLLRVPQVDTGLGFDLSPDGRKVAFSWNATGNWEIYELDLSASTAPPAALSAGDVGSKFSPRYSPDGERLAYAWDPDGSESYHIVLLDLKNNRHIDLTPDSAYAHQPNFAFSPDGKRLAVLSDERGQFALYSLVVESGERRLLFDPQHPCWDVRWSPDGQRIAVQAETDASNYGIFIVSAQDGDWQQIKFKGKELNAQQPAWSPDSRYLAFSGESEEWHNIGLYDVELTQITWLTQNAGDNISPCWSRDGRCLAWLHAEGAATSIVLSESGGSIEQFEIGIGVHSHPRLASPDEIICIFESPKHPPDLWKLDLNGASARQLTNSLPRELLDEEFVVPQEIWYESEDGAQVPALLYRATNNDGQAVINIHGGPNWHAQFSWDPLITYMASRGWTVLTPNYRGSTGYGKRWQNASRFDMGGVDTRDVAAGAQYLIREGIADPKRIAVTGRSHGGYLTMTCLTQFPELWCGGSAVAPFLNWFKSHEESRQDLQHWNLQNMGDPKENYEIWYKHSPYFFLDRIQAPVQLICGGKDPRCPASDSMDARERLVALGKTAELLLYPNEGHYFLSMENILDAETRRIEFLTKLFE
jgi:dipeptidyl aminopeptidase/acylaminoacyl peptidase